MRSSVGTPSPDTSTIASDGKLGEGLLIHIHFVDGQFIVNAQLLGSVYVDLDVSMSLTVVET